MPGVGRWTCYQEHICHLNPTAKGDHASAEVRRVDLGHADPHPHHHRPCDSCPLAATQRRRLDDSPHGVALGEARGHHARAHPPYPRRSDRCDSRQAESAHDDRRRTALECRRCHHYHRCPAVGIQHHWHQDHPNPDLRRNRRRRPGLRRATARQGCPGGTFHHLRGPVWRR